jgi:hypothetical protein
MEPIILPPPIVDELPHSEQAVSHVPNLPLWAFDSVGRPWLIGSIRGVIHKTHSAPSPVGA